MPPTLIEDYLKTLEYFGGDASTGVVGEKGGRPLPKLLTHLSAGDALRPSDIFRTGNTLVNRKAFSCSGLFDLAFEREAPEGLDLGMRVYLGGNLVVLNPEISIFHHRAPSGGLRAYLPRVITHAISCQFLVIFQLPSVTELYWAIRNFSVRKVEEMIWFRVLRTFRIRGPYSRRLLTLLVTVPFFPYTYWKIRQNPRRAKEMLQEFPQIPAFSESDEKRIPKAT